MLETGLCFTADDCERSSSLNVNYDRIHISDDFRLECENIIIDFMIQAKVFLTEKELTIRSIGHDLWMSLSRGHSWFNGYKHGDKLKEVVEKFRGLDLENKLNEAVKR